MPFMPPLDWQAGLDAYNTRVAGITGAGKTLLAGYENGNFKTSSTPAESDGGITGYSPDSWQSRGRYKLERVE